MPTLHLYLDESGDLNFSPAGTRYYFFTVAWTMDPFPVAHDLGRLRFDFLKQGHDLPLFHAAPNRQAHRDAVIEVLSQHTNWWFAAIVVEKSKVNPVLRADRVFYPKFASMVLRFVLRGRLAQTATRVLAFTDRLPVKKHRASINAAFKSTCRQSLQQPFNLYHHPSGSNYWLQVVDYCCWAVQRKWMLQDLRTYERLAGRLAERELDVLLRGNTHYY